jgi:hypothetical protein
MGALTPHTKNKKKAKSALRQGASAPEINYTNPELSEK